MAYYKHKEIVIVLTYNSNVYFSTFYVILNYSLCTSSYTQQNILFGMTVNKELIRIRSLLNLNGLLDRRMKPHVLDIKSE
jgi:hypothetical protein